MIYCFDVDGTICGNVENAQYHLAEPNIGVIDEINRLYDAGNVIKVVSARGSASGWDHQELTRKQLDEWGVRFHELVVDAKSHAHLLVDDRGPHVEAWLANVPATRGVVAGAFDVIHPGYVHMFAEAKRVCNHLTILLHADPSAQREAKLKPVLSVDERSFVLNAIRYVDDVVVYETEDDLYQLLKTGRFAVRFLGDDYRGKPITGADLAIPIHWIERSHNYSTTNMKRAIYETVAQKSKP